MNGKCVPYGSYTYSSGSEKNTDSATIEISNKYYFDVPSYLRLSETGYRRLFNNSKNKMGENNG